MTDCIGVVMHWISNCLAKWTKRLWKNNCFACSRITRLSLIWPHDASVIILTHRYLILLGTASN
jgi:hypothetical protein